jgi:hypothetical protein
MDADGEAAVAAVRAEFWRISEIFLNNTQHELEQARAVNDREDIVRRQIKLKVMKHARSILDYSIGAVWRAGEVNDDGQKK